jgi:hypothetical protein
MPLGIAAHGGEDKRGVAARAATVGLAAHQGLAGKARRQMRAGSAAEQVADSSDGGARKLARGLDADSERD